MVLSIKLVLLVFLETYRLETCITINSKKIIIGYFYEQTVGNFLLRTARTKTRISLIHTWYSESTHIALKICSLCTHRRLVTRPKRLNQQFCSLQANLVCLFPPPPLHFSRLFIRRRNLRVIDRKRGIVFRCLGETRLSMVFDHETRLK